MRTIRLLRSRGRSDVAQALLPAGSRLFSTRRAEKSLVSALPAEGLRHISLPDMQPNSCISPGAVVICNQEVAYTRVSVEPDPAQYLHSRAALSRVAVSYTHLDVYKRQINTRAMHAAFHRRAAISAPNSPREYAAMTRS